MNEYTWPLWRVGGAESRGNGARPVEWMIMNDTCATHRSRVPRRASEGIKGGVTTLEDERGPGLDFTLCFGVWQSSVRAAAFHLVVYFTIKVVECSPVPASFFPYLSTSLHWCRNPGGRRDTLSESPRCWVGSRCWEDRAAGSGGDRQWLPEAVVLEQKKNSGTEDSLPCSWVEEGWLPSGGSGGVAPFAWRPKPAHPPMFGEEQGTGDSLPAALDRRSHRRPPGGGWASGRPPKRSSTIAWHREWTAQLVEDRAAVCPGTGPRFFFSPLSPSRLCHSSSFRLLSLASSVLTPGTPRPPWRAPPGRGGRGGVERSLVSTPRPARGDGGMWRVGRGREPWNGARAGGVNDNERHLRHSPVSSPTEELRKE